MEAKSNNKISDKTEDQVRKATRRTSVNSVPKLTEKAGSPADRIRQGARVLSQSLKSRWDKGAINNSWSAKPQSRV